MSGNPLISGASTPTDPQWLGIYHAKVVNANDPLGLTRVQLQVPQVLGNAISNWATPMQPGIDPAVGTNCLCVFIGGNPNMPQYFLGLSNDVIANVQINSNMSVLNANPMFTGGILTPWTAVGCNISATVPDINLSPPFVNGCLLTSISGAAMYIQDAFFEAVPNAPYSFSAWVLSPSGKQITLGFLVEDNGGNVTGTDFSFSNSFPTNQGQWTYISTVVKSPPNTAMLAPIIGDQTSTPGELLTVEACVCTGQIPGSLIQPGTVTPAQISFTAPDIGAVQVFVESTQPPSPNLNDLWFNSGNGNQLFQWNGTNWLPYQWGSSTLTQGAVVNGVIAEGAIDGLVINGLTINGNTISAADLLITDTQGGIFVYTQGTGTVVTLTSGTTWKAPPGVTSVKVECWGGGGGGGSPTGQNGGGAGGGEYAAEPTLAVTPNSNYTYAIGAGGAGGVNGGNTTFAGDSVTVTAHGGTKGSGTTGGAGGTGSSNTTHFNGGAGGNGGGGSVNGSHSITGPPGAGTWTAPAGVTSVKVQAWGGGGGGAGGTYQSIGGKDLPGCGGGGGEFAQESALAVTPGNVYNYVLGYGGTNGVAGWSDGTAGGDSTFTGDSVTVHAHAGGGGLGSKVTGGGGAGGSGSTNSIHHPGGNGGNTSEAPYNIYNIPDGTGGGGAGGVTGIGNNGQIGTTVSGGTGGAGGTGTDALGTVAGTGGKGGDSGNAGNGGSIPGGGGGGGEGWSGGVITAGGGGGRGRIDLSWSANTLYAGGGGGSGGPNSVGNVGQIQQGAVAVVGGGPGGGTMSGGVFSPSTTSGPGGGGGGEDPTSSGLAGTGAKGQIVVTYSSGTPALLFSACGAAQNDPIASTACPIGLCVFQNDSIDFVGTGTENTHGSISAPVARQLQLQSPKTASNDNQATVLLKSNATGTNAQTSITGDLLVSSNNSLLLLDTNGQANIGTTRGYLGYTNNQDSINYNDGRRVYVAGSNQNATGAFTNLTWQPGGITQWNMVIGTYFVSGMFLMGITSGTVNPQFQWLTTSSVTYSNIMLMASTIVAAGSVANEPQNPVYTTVNTNTGLSTGYGTTGAQMWFQGIIKASSTGVFKMQFYNSGGGTLTVDQGSFMVWEPVPDV